MFLSRPTLVDCIFHEHRLVMVISPCILSCPRVSYVHRNVP